MSDNANNATPKNVISLQEYKNRFIFKKVYMSDEEYNEICNSDEYMEWMVETQELKEEYDKLQKSINEKKTFKYIFPKHWR